VQKFVKLSIIQPGIARFRSNFMHISRSGTASGREKIVYYKAKKFTKKSAVQSLTI